MKAEMQFKDGSYEHIEIENPTKWIRYWNRKRGGAFTFKLDSVLIIERDESLVDHTYIYKEKEK